MMREPFQHRSSPLVQGGLEIPIDVKVEWANEKALDILKGKVHSVGFSMDEAYKDASENILKKILGEDKNEFSSDDNDDVAADNQSASEEKDDDVVCTSRRHFKERIIYEFISCQLNNKIIEIGTN